MACIKYLVGSWHITSTEISVCYSNNNYNKRRKRNKYDGNNDDDSDDYHNWLWMPIIGTVILALLLTSHDTVAFL